MTQDELLREARDLLVRATCLVSEAREARGWRAKAACWVDAYNKTVRGVRPVTFEIEIEREPEPPARRVRPSLPRNRKRKR